MQPDKTKQRTIKYNKNDEGWDDKEDFERFVVFADSDFYKQLIEEEL